ncbi:MAG: hypothetical protein L0220_02565 [Acidobacteria bacterium]|nr:hypothetical protein [Acidobacteriota bacterium]
MSKLNVILVFIILTVFSLDAHAQRRGALAGAAPPPAQYEGLLVETGDYELSTARSGAGRSGRWCAPPTSAQLILTFKVREDYVIKLDDAYRQRFEKEMLPAIQRHCSPVSTIYVSHYIHGVRISSFNYQIFSDENDPKFKGTDSPLSAMKISVDPQGRLEYQMIGGISSLAEARLRARQYLNDTAKSKEKEDLDAKIAGLEFSTDGKLKIAGLQPFHKKLFLKIYNGEFAELSRPDGDEYLPYLMFSGLIQGYNDLCRDSLSKSAVPVNIYSERHVRTDFGPFVTTKYYETYLSKTVYVELKYEAAYRSSVATFVTKIWEHYRRSGGDVNIIQYFIHKTSSGLELAVDSRKLISNNGCKNLGTLKFIDNLHKFVTGNWDSKLASGEYDYTEEDEGFAIKRYYRKVPSTFSPKFPVPGPYSEKEIHLILNDGEANSGLRWVIASQFGGGAYLFLALKDMEKQGIPKYVQDAIGERKYHTVTCSYRVSANRQENVHYWNANGPLPPAPVQEFLKSLIIAPRTECPATYPGR